jgi:prepilin-type N-terminal cleavage/methylation domain-containing protein
MEPRSLLPRTRLHAEDGLTLIELLVTILILTVGLLALVGAFSSARKLTFLSERRTSAAHRAQLEIERLQALSYGELAMISAPSHSTEIANPDYYVNEAGTEYQYGTSSAEKGKLVTESGGLIAKEPAEWKERKCSEKVGACEWEDGGVKGYVYDFVTSQKDKTCTTSEESYKRLTVVVTVKVPSGSRAVAPTRVSTLVVNPKETKTAIEGC